MAKRKRNKSEDQSPPKIRLVLPWKKKREPDSATPLWIDEGILTFLGYTRAGRSVFLLGPKKVKFKGKREIVYDCKQKHKNPRRCRCLPKNQGFKLRYWFKDGNNGHPFAWVDYVSNGEWIAISAAFAYPESDYRVLWALEVKED